MSRRLEHMLGDSSVWVLGIAVGLLAIAAMASYNYFVERPAQHAYTRRIVREAAIPCLERDRKACLAQTRYQAQLCHRDPICRQIVNTAPVRGRVNRLLSPRGLRIKPDATVGPRGGGGTSGGSNPSGPPSPGPPGPPPPRPQPLIPPVCVGGLCTPAVPRNAVPLGLLLLL